MAEQTLWRPLIIVDNVPHIDYGSKSREAQIQAEREKTVLQELYLNRTSLIDSPHEPDTELYDFIEPAIIPLDDLTGNPDAINNFKDIAWPAPKGEAAAPFMSNAFANVFPNINVGPPLGFAANPIVGNPLANFSLSGIISPTSSIQPPNLLNQWSIPPTVFMQQVPTMIIPPPAVQNSYNSSNNNNNNRNAMGNNYRSNTTNNNNSSRGFSSNSNNSGGNWVRGNARRGICNQFQRTGFCRNGANCVYIHER
jgi:protein phosphatase 1 regulatory subunit 10